MPATANVLDNDNTQVLPKSNRRASLLQRLSAQGWTVRLKTDDSRAARSSADSLTRAIQAALLAYHQSGKSGGDGGQPCRAAIRAYQRVRPGDSRTSERVACALVVAMREWPAAFGRSAAMAR